jgi:hypothetical protein
VIKKEKRRFCGFKWRFAPMASLCFVVFISGGSLSFGRLLSESDIPPQTGAVQPPTDYASDFSLCSFPVKTASLNGYGAGPIELVLQEQPFVEAPVRLRNDNPEFSKRSPILAVALRVVFQNLLTWAVDRFVFNYDFSHIGPKTWNHNLQTGWEWDTDRFGMNFFFHPYSGGGYFMSARANGYGFLGSLPFSFFGSRITTSSTRPSAALFLEKSFTA